MGLSVEEVAQMAHEANAAYCRTIGDNSHASWADTPENIKESARVGVIKHLENPHMTAEQSHESWLEFKAADGWHYGPVKDAERKTHPCFLPYRELPESDRIKDHIFRAVVRGCVATFGVGSVRR
jgi:hypothetical protein